MPGRIVQSSGVIVAGLAIGWPPEIIVPTEDITPERMLELEHRALNCGVRLAVFPGQHIIVPAGSRELLEAPIQPRAFINGEGEVREVVGQAYMLRAEHFRPAGPRVDWAEHQFGLCVRIYLNPTAVPGVAFGVPDNVGGGIDGPEAAPVWESDWIVAEEEDGGDAHSWESDWTEDGWESDGNGDEEVVDAEGDAPMRESQEAVDAAPMWQSDWAEDGSSREERAWGGDGVTWTDDEEWVDDYIDEVVNGGVLDELEEEEEL